MSREYKIDVLVETHGAADQINRVADAEDRVVASSQKADGVIEKVNVRFKDAKDVAVIHEQALREGTRGWETYTVSAEEANQVLSEMPTLFGELRGGLNDTAEAAGITVEQLGLLGTAGAIFGAAMAGWGIGRSIAEFFELDGKIARATASMMGWGDAVKEAAGAKADALARASQIVGREITDLGEAMKINAQQVKEWSDGLARAQGPRESVIQIERWNQELDKVKAAGVLHALTVDIQSHNFSHQELADRYRISSGALAFYTSEMRDAEAESKAYDAQLKKQHAEEAKAIADEIRLQKQLQAEHTEILRISTAINREYDGWLAKHDQLILKLQTEAAMKEFKAREDVMGGYGLSANGTPLSALNDPLVKTAKALEDLAAAAQKGVSQEYQKQQIYDDFTKSELEAAKAADALNVSSRGAAGSGDTVSKSHMGAARAGDSAAASFGSFSQTIAGYMPTVNVSTGQNVQGTDPRIISYMSMGYTQGEAMALVGGYGWMIGAPQPKKKAMGGPVNAGESYWVGDGGEAELFTPTSSGTITPKSKMAGGGASTVIYMSVDAKGATFQDDMALDRLTDKIAIRLGARATERGANQ